MPKTDTNPKVDAYLLKSKRWRDELEALRAILLECGLTEELKWYQPCYTHEGANVVILHGMKESCAIAFFKGALLKDPAGILVAPGPNSQSGRWVKFTSVQEIAKRKSTLKAYIREAVAVEKAGLEVEPRKTSDFAVPEELLARFKTDAALKAAFAALTPGRQRGYLIHFSGAKQSATRASRIEKCAKAILAGKGLHD